MAQWEREHPSGPGVLLAIEVKFLTQEFWWDDNEIHWDYTRDLRSLVIKGVWGLALWL